MELYLGPWAKKQAHQYDRSVRRKSSGDHHAHQHARRISRPSLAFVTSNFGSTLLSVFIRSVYIRYLVAMTDYCFAGIFPRLRYVSARRIAHSFVTHLLPKKLLGHHLNEI